MTHEGGGMSLGTTIQGRSFLAIEGDVKNEEFFFANGEGKLDQFTEWSPQVSAQKDVWRALAWSSSMLADI